jgi:hypothetical protein
MRIGILVIYRDEIRRRPCRMLRGWVGCLGECPSLQCGLDRRDARRISGNGSYTNVPLCFSNGRHG